MIDIAITYEFIDEVSATMSRSHLDEKFFNYDYREKLIEWSRQIDYYILGDSDKKEMKQ